MENFKDFFITYLKAQNLTFEVEENDFVSFVFEDRKIIIYYFLKKTDLNIKFNHNLAFTKINIWEDLWLNAKEIIISRINSIFGLNHKIPARVCKIKRIEKKEAENFLNQNHLQNYVGAKLKYGLFLPLKHFRLLPDSLEKINETDRLIGVMTFSNPKNYYIDNQTIASFELVRFATLINFNVQGAFTKFLKHFIHDKKPGNIMTYIDKDWSDGLNFRKFGFEIISETEPMHFNLNENGSRILSIEKEDWQVKNSGSIKFILSDFERYK